MINQLLHLMCAYDIMTFPCAVHYTRIAFYVYNGIDKPTPRSVEAHVPDRNSNDVTAKYDRRKILFASPTTNTRIS